MTHATRSRLIAYQRAHEGDTERLARELRTIQRRQAERKARRSR
jgi:hypothetical protein